MKETEFKQMRCPDCDCKEGEQHENGCDMERCPFCHGQLISCDCSYEKLGYGKTDYYKKYCGLPKEVYEDGLSDKELDKWDKILDKKGRIPYIIHPVFCERCLTPYPLFFRVPNKEWAKIPAEFQDKVLCKKCYNKIKKWVRK